MFGYFEKMFLNKIDLIDENYVAMFMWVIFLGYVNNKFLFVKKLLEIKIKFMKKK